jgi:5-(carboxyamino)imidazole ribonucleotide mutase
MIQVAVIVGSGSDKEVITETGHYLDYFGVPYETVTLSAHRTPDRLNHYIHEAEDKGVQVFIAAAGMAAHLAGAVASRTNLPVIGIPMASGELKGLDALLSTVQMPSGIPVATMAIGKAGAVNAAIMAVRILALSDQNLHQKLKQFVDNGCKLPQN